MVTYGFGGKTTGATHTSTNTEHTFCEHGTKKEKQKQNNTIIKKEKSRVTFFVSVFLLRLSALVAPAPACFGGAFSTADRRFVGFVFSSNGGSG